MKIKYLKFFVLTAALLFSLINTPERAVALSAEGNGGRCDSSVSAGISPNMTVNSRETFTIDVGASYQTYEPVDGGQNHYSITLYQGTTVLKSWSSTTPQQPVESGSYVVQGGITSDTDYSVVAEVSSDISCPGGASDSATMTASVSTKINTPDTCTINFFTADNSNPAYNTGTDLHYSLNMVGSFTWNISLRNGSVAPTPSSGTGTDGISSTGNLIQSQIYRLTCGNAFQDVTVTPAPPPPPSSCQDTGATNYGQPLPCTYTTTCQDHNATNYGGALPCTYSPYSDTCTNPVATNYGRPLPCTFAQICQDRNATNYGGALPCTYQQICQDSAANNFGGALPCDYTPPTCSAASDCISASSYVSGGQTRVRANWVISPSCSGSVQVIQNVVRFRQVGDGWSMSNYFARPMNERSFMFPNYFSPGSYEISIKTHNINARQVILTLPCEPPIPIPPSGTLSATSCEIPAGASTCNSLLTWNISNPTSGTTEVTCNNPSTTHVSYDVSASNFPNTIRYGVDGITTCFLNHNINGTPTVLAQATTTASCGAGSIWDGSICKAGTGMTGTLTPAALSCKIALNKSNCKINFSWHVDKPVVVDGSAVTIDPNVTVGTGDDGTNVPMVVKYSSETPETPETFYLYNNAVRLATSTVGASCTTGTEWNGVRCIETIISGECRNGATNPPACTINGGGSCVNGATNPPACTINGGGSCINGATNPPLCTNDCANGATNPPTCTISGGGSCVNGATNPPTCTISGGGSCVNGATNPPACTINGGGSCVNGAINPPTCTINPDGDCLNGTYNPPLCTDTRKPMFIED